MTDPYTICIAGAGLVGSLFAYALKKRGYQVYLFEKRRDGRKVGFESGRSINLVLTARGVHTLRQMGLETEILATALPVMGRMIHSPKGELNYQPYGRDKSECNYALSRSHLNNFLMDKAEEIGVKIFFESELKSLDHSGRKAFFKGYGEKSWDLFFGCDGASSSTRRCLVHSNLICDQVEWLGVDYKELFMPPKAINQYALEAKALHIWPRGEHLLMALPNLGGSFTATLYMPAKGEISFEKLGTKNAIFRYFKTYYSDSLDVISDLAKTFFKNPQGRLGTVRCSRLVGGGRVALLGDAAHAIVPFFGQGMNCGFEDISCLIHLWDQQQERGIKNWERILEEYHQLRKPHVDAIADMAIENFKEMAEKVGQKNFLLRKEVEGRLEKSFPDKYRSRYGMVMYTLIPYAFAFQAGLIQEKILDELCLTIKSVEELDLKKAQQLIEQKLTPFFKDREIGLDCFR